MIISVLSLSARRAWIEIDPVTDKAWALEVALRKESVDRNYLLNFLQCLICRSLSARRAWIEIRIGGATMAVYKVALRKESVDRNSFDSLDSSLLAVALRKESVDRNRPRNGQSVGPGSRSPQGERG